MAFYSLALPLIALVLFGRPTVAAAQAAAPLQLSVEEAVDRALRTNERARIARAQVDRTEGQVREAFARALPTIDAGYNLTRNLQRPVLFFNQEGETQQIQIGEANEHAFSVSLEQPIFDKSLGAAVSAARHGREASEASYARALSEVALAARGAYYDALLARAQVGVRENAVELEERRLAQVRLFHDVGTASDFDLLTAEVALENERPALIQARNAFVLAVNGVKRVAGIGLDEPVRLTDTLAYRPVTIALDDAIARALESRDDLRGQAETVRLQEELVEVERAEAFPTLSLLLDLTRRASSEDFVPEDRDFSQSATAGLALRIPLFDGREAQGRTLQAQADYVAAVERLRALERDVRLETLDAWQSVQAAEEAVEATRATVERARRAFEIALVRFRNGLSTQLELDEAQQNVFEAESNAARALYDHMLATARLANAMGER